ncbi:MAG: outer membrane protein assembly factor BamE [Casimicrobiaceae bacterium]|nr:outer membrane protein assembly factor BamE [Casimicrobiaceae bacterium]
MVQACGQRLHRLVALGGATLALAALAGCGVVYRMEINQGNYVTREQAERLREGQTKQQVRAILGTPTVESVFHPDRWDYQFSLERHGRLVTRHRLTVFFENDRLKRWESADLPTSPLVDRDPAYAAIESGATAGDRRGWWSWLTDWWRR